MIDQLKLTNFLVSRHSTTWNGKLLWIMAHFGKYSLPNDIANPLIEDDCIVCTTAWPCLECINHQHNAIINVAQFHRPM